MRFDENADLDTSQIDDLRGRGGGGAPLGGRVAIGGGGLGVLGLILYFLLTQLGGGGGGGFGGGYALPGGLSGLSPGETADSSQIAESCRAGSDANSQLDCEVVAVVNSLDGFWSDTFARSGQTYQPPRTNFFSGSVRTGGCGGATSATGPFYCPADGEVYIDLSFFQELESRFGAEGGPFARAYVIAHEYGHHIQNLLGTSSRVRPGDTGPTSGAVRLELQADCYAGVWANHAETTPTSSGEPLIVGVTQQDVAAALDTAARIGDDYIQSELGGGRVDESQFTHGTSAQREKWYSTGYRTGDPAACDTFARGVDLG
ncbi:KPN_02809 family neutral zinc metallopeptidase [Pseudonocardia nigra]|uniref:KPN_02809 family neutral zinc metallopeptidase n=1 Tax=Pseudonocardia nigra TaxID=1921578 RepID=UPI001C5E116E|nr:neutral zinc metallopeptidase [Pseudonocardia nigra]